MFAAKNELFTRPSGYTISRSVRLRSSASAYFNRTFGTPTSTTTWSLSWWVKRGNLTANAQIFSAGGDFIYFGGATLVIKAVSGAVLKHHKFFVTLVLGIIFWLSLIQQMQLLTIELSSMLMVLK